jgi:phasin
MHHSSVYLLLTDSLRRAPTPALPRQGSEALGRHRAAGPESEDEPPAQRKNAMTDVSSAKPAKPASKPATSPVVPMFEMPKFDMPKFEMPKFEVPPAFREIAEKSVAQAKETYEKVKAAAEEATDVLEDTYTTAAKGASEYNLKVLEAARSNSNAAFDFAKELLDVKSLSDAVELSTAHARKQFEAMTAQTKELAALAQKVATETAEPIKNGMGNAFKKVA